MLWLFIFIIIVAVIFIALWFYLFGPRLMASGFDAESAYDIASCLVVGSVIATSLSFFAVSIALKNPKTDIGQNEVIVDILSILVTVLMGWNILSVVDIRRKADKVDHVSKDLEQAIKGMMQLNVKSFYMVGDYEVLLDNCFTSLEHMLQCKGEVKQTAVTELLKLMNTICTTVKDGKKKIKRGKRLDYQIILYSVKNIDTSNILKYINDAQEVDINPGPNILEGTSTSSNEIYTGIIVDSDTNT